MFQWLKDPKDAEELEVPLSDLQRIARRSVGPPLSGRAAGHGLGVDRNDGLRNRSTPSQVQNDSLGRAKRSQRFRGLDSCVTKCRRVSSFSPESA